MESSVTTGNIQAEPKPKKLIGGHNHARNFNRYVAGCPECMRRCPDGPPPNGYLGKKPRNRLSAEKLAVKTKETIESTQAALDARADELIARAEEATRLAREASAKLTEKQDPMQALVELMLRREAKTIEKEEDVEKRRLAAREDMLRVTREQEAHRLAHQSACNHMKENGRTAVNGQVHNDGLYHPFCQRCMKEFKPVTPSQEQISNGVLQS